MYTFCKLNSNHLTGGKDFDATSPIQVLIPGGQTRAPVDVKLVDSVELEGSEKFRVSIDPLSLPFGVCLDHKSNATEVVILDDDGMCRQLHTCTIGWICIQKHLIIC